jgi:hypothetical protein
MWFMREPDYCGSMPALRHAWFAPRLLQTQTAQPPGNSQEKFISRCRGHQHAAWLIVVVPRGGLRQFRKINGLTLKWDPGGTIESHSAFSMRSHLTEGPAPSPVSRNEFVLNCDEGMNRTGRCLGAAAPVRYRDLSCRPVLSQPLQPRLIARTCAIHGRHATDEHFRNQSASNVACKHSLHQGQLVSSCDD